MPTPALLIRAFAAAAPVLKSKIPLVAAFLAPAFMPAIERQGTKIADAAGDGLVLAVKGVSMGINHAAEGIGKGTGNVSEGSSLVYKAVCARIAHFIQPKEKTMIQEGPIKPPVI